MPRKAKQSEPAEDPVARAEREIEAMKRIVAALKPLTPEKRERVLKAAAILLDISQ